jgi:hypothetical protein
MGGGDEELTVAAIREPNDVGAAAAGSAGFTGSIAIFLSCAIRPPAGTDAGSSIA